MEIKKSIFIAEISLCLQVEGRINMVGGCCNVRSLDSLSHWEMSLMDRYFYVSVDLQNGDYWSQNWIVEILSCAFGIKLQRNSTGEIGQRLIDRWYTLKNKLYCFIQAPISDLFCSEINPDGQWLQLMLLSFSILMPPIHSKKEWWGFWQICIHLSSLDSAP